MEHVRGGESKKSGLGASVNEDGKPVQGGGGGTKGLKEHVLVLLLASDRSPAHASLCRCGDLLEGSQSIAQNLSTSSVRARGEVVTQVA